MNAFWISLGLTFWAEMGDKTQLLALAYAVRYPLRAVLLGIFWGTAAVLLVSALIGKLIAGWLPMMYVHAFAALCFLGFGIWTLREAGDGGEVRSQGSHPIWLIGSTFFLIELGDKTMLATLALASTLAWLPVWLGSTVGMLLSDGAAVYAGRVLGKRIPEKVMKGIAAGLFFGFAAWYAFQAWRSF